MSQLGASIATTIQTRAAMFLPNILGTQISLITIGVISLSSSFTFLTRVLVLDLGSEQC